jgi:glycosyltransferase EpsD
MEKRAARSGLGLPERAFVLIYAAEFSRRKNQSFLIKCMGRLPEEVVLVLAGKGALEKECRELAVREGVSGRVVFAGQIEDLSPYYSAADVCVSSSRSEGLPFNIMEGLHYSLPAVATRVKGHEDLITQGENGFLYDYGDGEAFCGYVERLAGNEGLRRGLGARARESVEKYSLERVLPAVLSLLPLADES